jgi:hypothetical protein
VWEQRVFLEDHAEVAAKRRDTAHVAFADDNASTIELDQPGDRSQRRRLAASTRSEEREELAIPDVELVDIEDDLRAKCLVQVFKPNAGQISL